MRIQKPKSDLGPHPGPSAAKPRSWRDAYPVLLGCLSEGRSPSGEEVERVVERMAREIGADESSVWSRAGAAGRRLMLLAAARAALLGRRDNQDPDPQFPLVPRGH